MKQRSKMGRPPLPKRQRLGKIFGVRLRPDEERDVLRAIQASGKSQPEWLREALLSAAKGK